MNTYLDFKVKHDKRFLENVMITALEMMANDSIFKIDVIKICVESALKFPEDQRKEALADALEDCTLFHAEDGINRMPTI